MKHLLPLAALLIGSALGMAQHADTALTRPDTVGTQLKLMQLNRISISAPKPLYSMSGEVVNYNVAHDKSVAGLTAWDAIRNAPTVVMDDDGNLKMRGSEEVEVWLNGTRTGMSGEVLRAFFESMPADALERIEVIKNPSAQYMVQEGKHILNIVTSRRLRTSQLWLLGLSGNTRPYLSPWASFVHNSDRTKFNFYLSGSHSHGNTEGNGSHTLTNGADTTSRQQYSSHSSESRYYGSLMVALDHKIDSFTSFNLNNLTLLQGHYNQHSAYHREQWDYSPDTAHYRYCDTSDSRSAMVNGVLNFDLKRRFRRAGQNLRLGGTWNYLFSSTSLLGQRLLSLAEGSLATLPLEGYDRTTDNQSSNNSVTLSLTYSHPLGDRDQLQLRLGTQPYGNRHRHRDIGYLDTLSGLYAHSDTLRNYLCNYQSASAYFYLSWRHEWTRTTLSLDLSGSLDRLRIDNRSLFPDDTCFRFFTLEPSLSLTHRTASMHYFRFRLEHSVATPSGSNLTVSRTYNDDSYSTGNRGLHNSTTEKASLSWNRYFEKAGNVSVDAYANYTSGGIESITASTSEADPFIGRIITYSIPFNIRASYKSGLDANATLRPAAWASLSLNAGLWREAYNAGDEWRRRTSWQLSANLWGKAFKLVNLSANLSYGSPTLSLYTESRNALTLGLNASATLLNGRLSLRLSLSDLLNSNRYNSFTQAPSYASTSSRHRDTRYLTFGLTYRLGKLDLEWQARSGAASQ